MEAGNSESDPDEDLINMQEIQDILFEGFDTDDEQVDEDSSTSEDDATDEENNEINPNHTAVRESLFAKKLRSQKAALRAKMPSFNLEMVRTNKRNVDSNASWMRRITPDFMELIFVLALWVTITFLIFEFTTMSEEIKTLVGFAVGVVSVPSTAYLAMHLYERRLNGAMKTQKVVTK